MGRIKIDVGAVISNGTLIQNARQNIQTAKDSADTVQWRLDNKIENRMNIGGRLDALQNQLSSIAGKVGHIRTVTEAGANRYRVADNQLESENRGRGSEITAKAAVSSAISKWADYFSSDDKSVAQPLVNWIARSEDALKKLMDKLLNAEKGTASTGRSVFAEASAAYTYCTTPSVSSDNVISKIGKVIGGTTSTWGTVYDFIEKKMKPLEASRFGNKYFTPVAITSLVGSMCNLGAQTKYASNVLIDEEASTALKYGAVFDSLSAGADVGGSALFLQHGRKNLTRGVTGKYQYGLSNQSSKALGTGMTIVSLVGVAFDALSSGSNRVDKVSQDGFIDGKEMGEIGAEFAFGGLASILNKATLGVSDSVFNVSERTEQMTDGMVNWAETDGMDFVRNHDLSSRVHDATRGLADVANDPNQPFFVRAAANITGGTVMIGAVAIDGVGDVCSYMKDGVFDIWNSIF